MKQFMICLSIFLLTLLVYLCHFVFGMGYHVYKTSPEQVGSIVGVVIMTASVWAPIFVGISVAAELTKHFDIF